MIDKSNTIDEYKKISKIQKIKSNIYFISTLFGFAVGVYGLSGIKDNDTLKYSLAGAGVIEMIISSELCHRSLRKRDYYESKIKALELIV